MNVRRLPAGYRLAGVMDFVRNRRLLLTVNIAALIITAVMIAIGLIVSPFSKSWTLLRTCWFPWTILPAMLIAYIALHELTHGVFMHALSGVRPRYGLRLCYAYAGSEVWFDRKSHIAIALAPLILWGVVLQILCAALPDGWFWPIWIVQISNVSGAVGDVYCSLRLIRYTGEILIQDTGTRMRIMKKTSKPSTEDIKK